MSILVEDGRDFTTFFIPANRYSPPCSVVDSREVSRRQQGAERRSARKVTKGTLYVGLEKQILV